jgi:hypothetical protein
MGYGTRSVVEEPSSVEVGSAFFHQNFAIYFKPTTCCKHKR